MEKQVNDRRVWEHNLTYKKCVRSDKDETVTAVRSKFDGRIRLEWELSNGKIGEKHGSMDYTRQEDRWISNPDQNKPVPTEIQRSYLPGTPEYQAFEKLLKVGTNSFDPGAVI